MPLISFEEECARQGIGLRVAQIKIKAPKPSCSSGCAFLVHNPVHIGCLIGGHIRDHWICPRQH
jgi:hypothetical protein